jgi:hypothetical protein
MKLVSLSVLSFCAVACATAMPDVPNELANDPTGAAGAAGEQPSDTTVSEGGKGAACAGGSRSMPAAGSAAQSGGHKAPSATGGTGGAAGSAPAAAGSGGSTAAEGGAGGAGDAGGAGGSAAAGSGGSGGAHAPALKFDCPNGNADADGNGYPDACEQLLWTQETNDHGTMVFYPNCAQVNDWTPTDLATIAIGFGDYVIEDTHGVAAGRYTANSTDAFSGVYDEQTYDASTNVQAQRAAAALLSGKADGSVVLTPAAGKTELSDFSNTEIWLNGKHVVYFMRVITGYGFDSSNDPQGAPRNQVCIRGGWRAYGY